MINLVIISNVYCLYLLFIVYIYKPNLLFLLFNISLF